MARKTAAAILRSMPQEKHTAIKRAVCFMLRTFIPRLCRMHELQISESVCVISIVNESIQSLARDDQALYLQACATTILRNSYPQPLSGNHLLTIA